MGRGFLTATANYYFHRHWGNIGQPQWEGGHRREIKWKKTLPVCIPASRLLSGRVSRAINEFPVEF